MKTEMAQCMTRRMQCAQLYARFALESYVVVVFNKAIDVNVSQCRGCLLVRRDWN